MILKTKKIRLKDLNLWDENARFPDKYFKQNENELIDYFVSKKDFKIIELAKSIIKDTDLPQIEKLVVLELEGKNIVIEGNRRITAYKLITNPSLTSNNKIRDFFQKINKTPINEDFELDCITTNNIEQALRYVDRKHNNNNFEVAWGQAERDNFKARRGRASSKELFRIGVIKLIKKLDIPEPMKEKVLGKGFVTTLFRIIDSSPAHKLYGFKINGNGNLEFEDENFPKKLKVIILNVLQKKTLDNSKKVDSRTLNKNSAKDEYLQSIETNDSKKVEKIIQANTKENLFGEKSTEISDTTVVKIFPKSTSRNHLIPKSCHLTITEPKINNIYRELRDNLLLDNSKKTVPNAVGVLFRVFLEISIDYYAKKNGRLFKRNDTIGKKISWIVKDLIEKGYNKNEFNSINKVGSGKKEETIFAIDNFHEYVHSYKTQPSPNDLKIKWDNLQEFFIILWNKEINN